MERKGSMLGSRSNSVPGPGGMLDTIGCNLKVGRTRSQDEEMASMIRERRNMLGEEFTAAREAAIQAREVAAKLIRREVRHGCMASMEQPSPLTQAAPLGPSIALRRLKVLSKEGESPHSEANFAFGMPPRGLAPRARILHGAGLNIIQSEGSTLSMRRILHHPPAPEDATAPSSRILPPPPARTHSSDEEHGSFYDKTEKIRSTSPWDTKEKAHSISPVVRQEPLSPTFVGTSERRDVLEKLLSRLTPQLHSALAKPPNPIQRRKSLETASGATGEGAALCGAGGASWGPCRAGSKTLVLKKPHSVAS